MENEQSTEIVLRFGVRRIRGRKDSVSITLPPLWIQHTQLGIIGKCFVDLSMDNKNRLIITPRDDMSDNAPNRKHKPEYIPEDESNYSDTQY